MAKIFISYSRVDRAFVEEFFKHLGRKYGFKNIWYDDQLHGGDQWWEAILDRVAWCDVFLYLLSNESVQSDYCQAEFQEALRLHKHVVTIQVRDRTALSDELGDIQYIDMQPGVDRADAYTRLYTALDRYMANKPRRMPRPLSSQRTPRPPKPDDSNDTLRPDVVTAPLQRPALPVERKRGLPAAVVLPIVVAIITGLFGLLAAGIGILPELLDNPAQPTATQAIVAQATTETPTLTLTDAPTNTPTPSPTPTPTPTNTPTPSPTPTNTPTATPPIAIYIQDERGIFDLIAENLAAIITGLFTLLAAVIPATIASRRHRDQARQSASNNSGTGVRTVTDILPAPFDWIEIPAGRVKLEGRKGSFIPEGTTRTINVPAFQIAKYPITNAQFRQFIEAGGYRERRYWTDAGWEAREQGWVRNGSEWETTGKPWTEPRYWTDETDERFVGDDKPVVGVSWYEAIAFCRWLNEALALKADTITLPTEQQWQRAAQSDDGRVYPWGDKWDCQRCNNSVSPCDSNATTPVTAYEGRDKGDSPYDVVDMAGNVWEWCVTAYETGDDALEGTHDRVLRGGAWFNSESGFFRAAYRGKFDPRERSNGRGFRLARSYEP